ncbi:MAG: AAA family ATPase [Candidatus Bilamarchaeaceae archaeon]
MGAPAQKSIEGTFLAEQAVRTYVGMLQKNESFWAAILVFLGTLSLLTAIPFYPLPVAFVLALACAAVAIKKPPIAVALGFLFVMPALSYQSAIFAWVGLLLLAAIFFEVFENWGEIALLEMLVLLPFAAFPLSLLGGLVFFGMLIGSFYFGSAKSTAIALPAVFLILLLSSVWLLPNSAFFPVKLALYSPGVDALRLGKPALGLNNFASGIIPALANMADLKAAGYAWNAVAQIGSNTMKLLFLDSGLIQLVTWGAVLFFAGWFPGNSRSRWKQTIASLSLLLIPIAYFFAYSVSGVQYNLMLPAYIGVAILLTALMDARNIQVSREKKISAKKQMKAFGKFGFADLSEEGGSEKSLDDVGGYQDVKKELRDSITLPLQRKELATAYGLKVPSGILLFGPPGTGKTMLMRALAKELQYRFVYIKTSDILSQWYGESEKNISEIFSRARETAPTLLFFDEIDSVGKRRDLAGTDSVTPRVLSVLLQEMDGIKTNTKPVIVVAATNVPDQLDPALLRPGRFDKIIYMHLPDEEARMEIFKVALRGLPTAPDIDFAALAKKTERFSGADIQAVCKIAMRKAAEEAKSIGKIVPIRMEHVLSVLEKTKPSTSLAALEEYEKFRLDFERSEAGAAEVEKKGGQPKEVCWEDVADLEDVKAAFKESIELPLLHPELVKEFGVKPTKGILLFGPPGCGKTLVVKAASNELKISFHNISGAQLMQKGYTHAVNVIKETFNRARENPPAVIFVDEIETFAPSRDSGRADIVGQFLVEMDGVKGAQGVMVVGATNRPDTLDSAILRPGRFDKLIYVHPPDLDGRVQLLRIHFKQFAAGLDLSALAQATEGFTGADIALLAQQVKMNLLREKMAGKEPRISTQEVMRALSGMRPSVTPQMLRVYEKFLLEYGERK